MDIYFTLWVIFNIIIICFSSYSTFVIGGSFRLVSVSFWCVHFLSQALPYFLVLQDIPDSSCTSPRIKHFPEEPQVPVIKECYLGIHLDARCAHCYWPLWLLGFSSGLYDEIHRNMHTYACTYIQAWENLYTCVCINIYMHVCINIHMTLCWYSQFQHNSTMFFLAFPIFKQKIDIYILLLQWEPWFPMLAIQNHIK